MHVLYIQAHYRFHVQYHGPYMYNHELMNMAMLADSGLIWPLYETYISTTMALYADTLLHIVM